MKDKIQPCEHCNHADGTHSERCPVKKAWNEVTIPLNGRDRSLLNYVKYGDSNGRA